MARTITRRGIFTEDKHAWSDEERHILWLLRTRTNLSDEQQNALFNYICGLELTPKVLRNQRMDGCRRLEVRSARWIAITMTDVSEPVQQERLTRIVSAAQQVGMNISVDGLRRSESTSKRSPLERIARLEMVHCTDMQWGEEPDEIPFWDAAEKLEVDPESEIYKHGGMVYRVRTGSEDEVDFMVCDSRFCACSNKKAKRALDDMQPGQPRVHISDLVRTGETMVFASSHRRHCESFTQGFERIVYFDIGDRLFPVRTTVCAFPNCKSCAAAKKKRKVDMVNKAETRANTERKIVGGTEK